MRPRVVFFLCCGMALFGKMDEIIHTYPLTRDFERFAWVAGACILCLLIALALSIVDSQKRQSTS